MVCLALTDAVLDKFGGDSLRETLDNLARYRERLALGPAAGTGSASGRRQGGAAPTESE
jgi:chorismate synthase